MPTTKQPRKAMAAGTSNPAASSRTLAAAALRLQALPTVRAGAMTLRAASKVFERYTRAYLRELARVPFSGDEAHRVAHLEALRAVGSEAQRVAAKDEPAE